MIVLIAESETTRIVKISNGSDKYEVIEESGSKFFDCLAEAKIWFDLISK